MSSQKTALRYPPGLNIHYSKPPIQPSGDQENAFCTQNNITTVDKPMLWDIQPRIRNLKLQLPRRSYKGTRGSTMQIEGTSLLRKKLGHATVMVACARHRNNRRRAAQQAAVYARLFNFTGEWSSEDAQATL
jgi:hypothetical protein